VCAVGRLEAKLMQANKYADTAIQRDLPVPDSEEISKPCGEQERESNEAIGKRVSAPALEHSNQSGYEKE
jgi:hypothetical protein